MPLQFIFDTPSSSSPCDYVESILFTKDSDVSYWELLPDEICTKIFHNLCVINRLNCELVCKHWRDIMPYVNMEIVLNRFTNCSYMHNLLATLEAKSLRKDVSIVSVKCAVREDCQIYYIRPITLPTVQLLHKLSASKLTELSLCCDFMFTDDCLLFLFRNFKQLKRLRCRATVPNNLNDSLSSAFPHLEYFHCLDWHPISWMPSDLPKSLVEFQAQSITPNLLLSVANTLKTLRFTTFANFDPQDKIPLTLMPRLETLEFHGSEHLALHLVTVSPNIKTLKFSLRDELAQSLHLMRDMHSLDSLDVTSSEIVESKHPHLLTNMLATMNCIKLKTLSYKCHTLSLETLMHIAERTRNVTALTLEAFTTPAQCECLLHIIFHEWVHLARLTIKGITLDKAAYTKLVFAPSHLCRIEFERGLSDVRDYASLYDALCSDIIEGRSRQSTLQLVHGWRKFDRDDRANRTELCKIGVWLVESDDRSCGNGCGRPS